MNLKPWVPTSANCSIEEESTLGENLWMPGVAFGAKKGSTLLLNIVTV